MRAAQFYFAALSVICAGMAQAGTAPGTIGLSPASISLKGSPGQMSSHSFRISNQTGAEYRFRVEVDDVVVENGERKFVPAGQRRGSLAALAVAPQGEIRVAPGEFATVPVTFVLPPSTKIRAVAVFVKGEEVGKQPRHGLRSLFSLGAVVDFTASDEVVADAGSPHVSPQSSTANLVTTQELSNIGAEPFIARGVAAFLDRSGKLVARAPFTQKRLLPGERNALIAEYPATLPAGKYKLMCSIEYGEKLLTTATEIQIP